MENYEDQLLICFDKEGLNNADKPIQSVNEFDPSIPKLLPHERMYSIQVGDRLFAISGASLSSDGPSYFTNFFQKNENEGKVLFIDRSPVVFEIIQRHLQGYHISIDDPSEYIHLFEDASYFNLSRLTKVVREMNYYVVIGSRPFVLERNLLNVEGNSPNYFTLAHDTLLQNPTKVIHQRNLIRPPPQAPLTVSNRSPHLFAMIVRYLQGESVDSIDDSLRQDLINECKYYRFQALEQKLIKHNIRTNVIRCCEEIVIDCKYISPKGLVSQTVESTVGYLMYQRPYVDKYPRELVMQISTAEASLVATLDNQSYELILAPSLAVRLDKLFGKFTSAPLIYGQLQNYEDPAKDSGKLTMLTRIDNDVPARINNFERDRHWMSEALHTQNLQNDEKMSTINLTRSLWKVGVHNQQLWMEAIKIEGITSVYGWNSSTSFL
ncbi:hypothetical protein LJB42_000796 [Komagataella kurtzmanii]|nr:hypothetical protein LJB42_000796 [Komagataella kurtzmanii]